MGKQPTFEELLRDPKAREKLNLAQFKEFVDRVRELTRGFGAIGRIDRSPADFAARISDKRWHHAAHLDYLSAHLELLHQRKIKRLMVSMPPRHGKSMLLDIFFPLWWLAQHPHQRVILASYGETFARGFGGKVRDLVIEHGEALNLVVNRDKMAADDWELSSGGGMVCVGVEGSITGRGADLLIVDDPVKNEEQALSERYREKMWDWWQATSQTRLEPNAVVVIVATRWHEDDLLGRIEKDEATEGDWTIIKLPALAEENDPLGREIGAPLWPERFYDDPEYAAKQRGMSPYWWSSLYQQRPTPEGGGIIKRDSFEFYDSQPESFDIMLQTWDLALKDKATSDYSVGQVWGRKGANLYLLNQVRGHFTLSQIQTHMRQFTAQYPGALAKLVEDSAMGPAIKQTLTHEIPGIIPVKPEGSKRSRVEAVEPIFNSHNIYVPVRADGNVPKWVWEYIEELVQFPKGANDDQVDATTQAITYLLPGGWSQLAREAKDRENDKPTDLKEQRREWFKTKFLTKKKENRERGLRTANW